MRLRNLFEAGENVESFDYGSVQVNIDGEVAKAILALGNRIPDNMLADDGREVEPHVTVRYGLISEPQTAVDALAGFGTIIARISGIDVFDAPEHDVLILTVESDDLRLANQLLDQKCEYKPADFPYRPHATVAYVKKGYGAKLKDKIKLTWLEGAEMRFSTAMVSAKDKSRWTISLVR